jgi:hypothetical protein
MGAGPMTGRAAGYCAGYDVPGVAGPGYVGRGFGLGWGGGRRGRRRWRHWFYATGLPRRARFGGAPAWGYPEPVTREQEVESLKAQAGWLKKELDAVNRCLEELENEE